MVANKGAQPKVSETNRQPKRVFGPPEDQNKNAERVYDIPIANRLRARNQRKKYVEEDEEDERNNDDEENIMNSGDEAPTFTSATIDRMFAADPPQLVETIPDPKEYPSAIWAAGFRMVCLPDGTPVPNWYRCRW